VFTNSTRVGGVSLVEVLMSTYNGERHLREQVDSILAQEGVEVRLVVRDDGSCDGTLNVLRSYAADPRVVVVQGENLGLPDAYFRLLEGSGADADYWALADQDDIWLPHKLARAVARLALLEGPALYCARVLVVDEDLRPLYPHPLPMRGPSFANALVQNIATGCTIVIDPRARDVLRNSWPSYAVMHDAWLYLVVSATGTVVYDPEVVVHYRQHAGNAVGMGRGRMARVAGRVRRQLSAAGRGAHGRQNMALLATHGAALEPALQQLLQGLLKESSGVLALRPTAAHRQTFGSNLVLWALRLSGRV
jgi:glycosyltransferase involved in cell wall biosynthesis